ncbi:MAG TPA: DinB family protein [Flavobacteriales bacterium]|nr:DinB family protein [Flavobacteriales bacterium]
MNGRERPDPSEVPGFYHGYVALATEQDLLAALRSASDRTASIMGRVPDGRGDHRYAPGKWSIKDVLQHVIDAERIFGYRALRFARNDATELPGFEENDYAPNALADRRELADLVAEFGTVRAATTTLFRSFSPEMSLRAGTANKARISVRALGWVIAGHTMHHMNVIEQRYF